MTNDTNTPETQQEGQPAPTKLSFVKRYAPQEFQQQQEPPRSNLQITHVKHPSVERFARKERDYKSDFGI